VAACYRLGLKGIVCPTASGRTARLISAHRPEVPVLAVSERLQTVRRMKLLFRVRSSAAPQNWASLRKLPDHCATLPPHHPWPAPPPASRPRESARTSSRSTASHR